MDVQHLLPIASGRVRLSSGIDMGFTLRHPTLLDSLKDSFTLSNAAAQHSGSNRFFLFVLWLN